MNDILMKHHNIAEPTPAPAVPARDLLWYVDIVGLVTVDPYFSKVGRTYWYLATPYSRYTGGLAAAFTAACELTGRLIKAGIPVFSPIAHSHPVALAAGMDPLDHKVWLPADAPLMAAAHGLLVAEMPGWEESVGIAYEIESFLAARKPTFRLSLA